MFYKNRDNLRCYMIQSTSDVTLTAQQWRSLKIQMMHACKWRHCEDKPFVSSTAKLVNATPSKNGWKSRQKSEYNFAECNFTKFEQTTIGSWGAHQINLDQAS